MGSTLLVLIVEDEAIIRMAIADHLVDNGFEVLEASNSKQAIALLSSHAPIDLVFTDVDMPGGMDGLGLAATIRERWPPIEIVVTSGYRRVRIDELPVRAQFLPKPYSAEAVAATLRQMVH